MNILAQLRSLFEPVLYELSPDRAKVGDYLAAIRQAQNPEHGDYQANFAMPLAKALGRKPQEVAADVIAKLISRRYPLEQAPEAITWAMANPQDALKVVVEV